MKHLIADSPGLEESVDLFTSQTHHVLSSLIVADGGDTVVVSAVSFAEAMNGGLREIESHGSQIAAACTRKFLTGPQQWYDWYVIHVPELSCFVGVRSSHPKLRN